MTDNRIASLWTGTRSLTLAMEFPRLDAVHPSPFPPRFDAPLCCARWPLLYLTAIGSGQRKKKG